ncbi:agmatinase family protein [Shimazuella sp. AN120528]|uniref:agmatinase family protein n=1 Tax=Shimazuella soli TaxID=1892854 RepID=UPI001F0E0D76|nr:agmatinase family protein [Shimazuella soli]MCH5584896.1 agmatinase family protein [Shimazuella soli]
MKPAKHLNPPALQYAGGKGDPYVTTIAEWIEKPQADMSYDLCVLGVPLSKSSISFSGAHLHPATFRKLWSNFTTYHWDLDLDFTQLRAVDFGDIAMHVTDIATCHQNIQETMQEVTTTYPEIFPITVGGDHSITAPLIKGRKAANGKRIGIIQFDAHLDVRDMSYGGPSNGTPIRNLVESKTVKGEDIVTIGIRNFVNSRLYRDYTEEKGIHVISSKQVHMRGIESVIKEAMERLEACEEVYVTFDIDALDQSFVPGVPAIGPQGLTTDQLFSSASTLGAWSKVTAMDMVCVDPSVDLRDITSRVSLHLFLHFVSGLCQQ